MAIRVLLEGARRVIAGEDPNRVLASLAGSSWDGISAGAFITVYLGPERTSDNVWCCMSNGEYDGHNSVLHNVVASAQICRSEDPRRSRSANTPTTFVEITLLKPRPWRRVITQQLDRRRQRAIHLQIGYRSAIYLPSVWDEESTWTPDQLVQSLAAKALGRRVFDTELQRAIISEIDVFEILHDGSSYSRGFQPILPKLTGGFVHPHWCTSRSAGVVAPLRRGGSRGGYIRIRMSSGA